ncbi:hypothetical protein ABZP36_006545 [Zizania latifolia]
MASTSASPHSLMLVALALVALAWLAATGDSNGVYDPCSDARIQRGDDFIFGVAFTSASALYPRPIQLSPYDCRALCYYSGLSQ